MDPITVDTAISAHMDVQSMDTVEPQMNAPYTSQLIDGLDILRSAWSPVHFVSGAHALNYQKGHRMNLITGQAHLTQVTQDIVTVLVETYQNPRTKST